MHSGHRIGTAEVESALASHPQCAEAAVVGVEHEVCRLEYAYVRCDTDKHGESNMQEKRTMFSASSNWN